MVPVKQTHLSVSLADLNDNARNVDFSQPLLAGVQHHHPLVLVFRQIALGLSENDSCALFAAGHKGSSAVCKTGQHARRIVVKFLSPGDAGSQQSGSGPVLV